jgi:transcriptional regulator with XRE-family HTH domain
MDRGLLYRLLGERIRNARTQQKPSKSQSAVALALGLSRTSMVNIEKGRQHTSLHVIWEIADQLGVEAASLIPPRRDYMASSQPVALDATTIDQIKKYASDDSEARRKLEEFVKWAKGRDSSNPQK